MERDATVVVPEHNLIEHQTPVVGEGDTIVTEGSVSTGGTQRDGYILGGSKGFLHLVHQFLGENLLHARLCLISHLVDSGAERGHKPVESFEVLVIQVARGQERDGRIHND